MDDRRETVEALERARRREVGDEDLELWDEAIDWNHAIDEHEQGIDLPVPRVRTRVRWLVVACWVGYFGTLILAGLYLTGVL